MIRPANLQDARAIAEIHVASWRETYAGIVPQHHLDGLSVVERRNRWEVSLGSATSVVLVAEHDGRVCGFASAGRAREPDRGFACELYAIYLLRSAQNTGQGRRLFEALAAELRHAGDGFYLWVLRDNPTVGFYRRLGGVYGASKTVEIGGKTLVEDLYGWR